MTASVALSSGAMFVSAIMACSTYMALSVSRLVCLEVIEGMVAAAGHRAGVTVVGIIAVINVAIEAARAMEPRSGSDKDSASEPIRPIISVRRTVVRGIVVVAIGTDGLLPYANNYLRLC